MRPHLRNGVLIPPRTVNEAVKRQRLLAGEISRIQEQLADPVRVRERTDYADWRIRATDIQNAFKREHELLGDWIVQQNALHAAESGDTKLLRRCFETLKILESDEALEPEELKLLRDLEARFNPKIPRTAGQRA